MARPVATAFAVLLAFTLCACSSADAPTDPQGRASADRAEVPSGPLVGAPEQAPPTQTPIATPAPLADAGTTDAGAGACAPGAKLVASTDLNLRSAPSTMATILMVVPQDGVVAVLDCVPQNGFLKVDFNGVDGWCFGANLKSAPAAVAPDAGTVDSGAVDPNGPASPETAIARARASVGFSYWWGGGAWLAGGSTSSTAGSCTGSCPSCSHSGQYGADCSGMIAKAWEFGPTALAVDAHPFATSDFIAPVAGKWGDVSRGSLKAGDALVHHSGGAGHIAMYESGDGWGSPTVYECRGCAYGCVHNTRSFSSIYKGIRRAGF